PPASVHCCVVVLPLFALLWRRVNVVAMSPSVSARLRAGTLLLPPSAGQTLAVSTCTAHRHGCGSRADEPDPDDGEQEGPLRTGEGKGGDTLLGVGHRIRRDRRLDAFTCLQAVFGAISIGQDVTGRGLGFLEDDVTVGVRIVTDPDGDRRVPSGIRGERTEELFGFLIEDVELGT